MRAEGSPKELGLGIFVRDVQLVKFCALLDKLEIERVQRALNAARGKRATAPPHLKKTSSAAAVAAAAARAAGTTSSSMRVSKQDSSLESAELPHNRGKTGETSETVTVTSQIRLETRDPSPGPYPGNNVFDCVSVQW